MRFGYFATYFRESEDKALRQVYRNTNEQVVPRIIEAPNARRDGRTCCGHHEWQSAAPDGRP
jgi:hypothetical protein